MSLRFPLCFSVFPYLCARWASHLSDGVPFLQKNNHQGIVGFHTKELMPMTSNLPDGEGLQIRPASFNDILFIQDIAYKTWPVAYGSILSQKQLDYMLEMIYSTAALQKQMHDNQHFFLALQNFIPVGFAAFSPIDDATHKLHKLYVLPGIQKMGAGKKLLQTIETTAKSMGATRLHPFFECPEVHTTYEAYELHHQ